MPSVQVFRPTTGRLAVQDLGDDDVAVATWSGGSLQLGAGTHMGVNIHGQARLRCATGVFDIPAGLTFCVPGDGVLEGSGEGLVVSHLAFAGLFMLSGPLEERGRLRYIDGCTDSVLIPPIVKGDPCLNFLRVPPDTRQTPHTHPSVRVGIVVSGRGVCRCEDRDLDLAPGVIFAIPPEVLHSFCTSSDPLRIVAWHPDSDTGPSDQDHPMINRTEIAGVSVRHRLELSAP